MPPGFMLTLWNNDENITNSFRARIDKLDLYNYPSSGYLPVDLLKDVLDASTLGSLSLNFNVDNKILGGLIVKIGSKMIDSSLASKINKLKVAIEGAQ